MNALERRVWAAVYGDSYNRYSTLAEPPRAAALAVSLADEAVLQLRERAELGSFHNDENLEAERRADLDLPEPGPTPADVANAEGDRHEARARELRHDDPRGIGGMLEEERALACYQVADELEATFKSILHARPAALEEFPDLPRALAEAVCVLDGVRERHALLRQSRRRWIDAIAAAVPEGWNTPDAATAVLQCLVRDSAELHRVARALGWSEEVNCPPWSFIESEIARLRPGGS